MLTSFPKNAGSFFVNSSTAAHPGTCVVIACRGAGGTAWDQSVSTGEGAAILRISKSSVAMMWFVLSVLFFAFFPYFRCSPSVTQRISTASDRQQDSGRAFISFDLAGSKASEGPIEASNNPMDQDLTEGQLVYQPHSSAQPRLCGEAAQDSRGSWDKQRHLDVFCWVEGVSDHFTC